MLIGVLCMDCISIMSENRFINSRNDIVFFLKIITVVLALKIRVVTFRL